VLIRPDGYVGWVGDLTQPGLPGALTTWFGAPTGRSALPSKISKEHRAGDGRR
jgi:hypothetical protein